MGVARSIEARLEGLMEGFFNRLFRSGVQPIEVGRRIVRQMEEGRTISVNRTYVPNEFRVRLSPEDQARFQPMAPGLEREFADMVIDEAKRNRWNLMGMPRIAFEQDEDLRRGELRVDASLAADADAQGPRLSTREPRQGDASQTRAISLDTSDRLAIDQARARLDVLGEDGDVKESISVTDAPVTIGRMSSNDIVLADPNVSRRHAELRRDAGRWALVDLGSTNGTVVNGKLAREHWLDDGDRVTFGTTQLVFRLGRAS